MKFYRKAEEAAQAIVEAFEQGRVPKALAQVFIQRKDESPCRSWSWGNQLLIALAGYSDARGFGQWKHAGRHVKAGEHSRCHILIPITVEKETGETDPETGEPVTRTVLVGFTTSPVFGLSQTEGRPLERDTHVDSWLASLPLRALADSWGLTVDAYNGNGRGALGYYSPGGGAIALGVENLSTWAHELCHAADDRLGNLAKSDRPDTEVVGELAGATLLECLGYAVDSDRGGAWEYVLRYCKENRTKALTACNRLLDRVCQVVAFILDEAAALAPREAEAAVSA